MRSPPLERQVLDALPITIYAVDLEGRVTFRSRTSPPVAPTKGAPLCDERAVVGASIWDAVTDPGVRTQMEEAMATLREGRESSLSWEVPRSSPAGDGIFVMQASPIMRRHVLSGYALATVNLTPSFRQTIGAEAVASTAAAGPDQVDHDRRADAISEVSAGVAHELRTPLSGISSAAQLLRFRVKDDPVVEKSVGRILREVERLNGIVTALLEYGRSNAIRLEPGDPDAVWDEVLEHQRGLLESRALLLHRTRAEPPAHCLVDAGQLASVFVNLLVNASDAAPEGTDLTLHSDRLPTGAWRCQLHNGGASIPGDVLPRVFEIFVSAKPGGNGIGLALCRRIIAQHGGSIALDSASERGTTVTVVLPATGSKSRER